MQPILLQLGPVTLYSYGVFIALSFLIGGLVTWRLAKQAKLSTSYLVDYFLYAALLGLIGARLWHLLFRPFEVKSLWEVFSLWGGGLALQGGLLLAIVGLIVIMRRQRQPVWQWLDVMAIGTMVGLAIGKFGSFMNGDYFGRSSQLPWTVQFSDPLAPGYIMGVPLHPLQLYAVLAYGLLAGLLYVLYRRRRKASPPRRSGFTFLVGLGLLSLTQLILEFWHAPIDSMYINNQIRAVSLTAGLVLAAVAVVLIRNYRKRPPTSSRHG